jgi:hypothetical protein
MKERMPISKKARFEVFKRDSFTCQYCGAKAPDVILEVDHIRPVADGGGNDVLNLVTSCSACNSGKGARKLDDRSAVERQRAQLEELQQRREQLEMILLWRDDLELLKTDTVELVAGRIADRSGLFPNEAGKSDIRRWLKRYSLDEILAAASESFDIYLRFRGDDVDQQSWETAFAKIPAIANIKTQAAAKPYIPKLCYIQGILRKRFRDRRGQYVSALEEFHLDGVPVDALEIYAKSACGWEEYCDLATSWLEASRGGAPN